MLKLRQLRKQKQEEHNRKAGQNGSPSACNSAARTRLKRDLDSLELPPTVSLQVVRAPTDQSRDPPLLRLTVSPDEGIYRAGHFDFELTFSESYPIEPPQARCLNRIFHPNIDREGKICLNILREDWSPALDLQSIVIGLLFLFLEVSGKDPLNKQAASALNEDSSKFARLVRQTLAGYSLDGQSYDNVLRGKSGFD